MTKMTGTNYKIDLYPLRDPLLCLGCQKNEIRWGSTPPAGIQRRTFYFFVYLQSFFQKKIKNKMFSPRPPRPISADGFLLVLWLIYFSKCFFGTFGTLFFHQLGTVWVLDDENTTIRTAISR